MSDPRVLLACLENAVRLAATAGASKKDIEDSVEWALKTPEETP